MRWRDGERRLKLSWAKASGRNWRRCAATQDGAGAGVAGADRAGVRGRAAKQAGRRRARGGSGHGRQVAPPLRGAAGWRAARRAALGRAAHDRGRAHRGGDRHDPGEPAGGRHALELARHGQGQRPVGLDGPAHLARLRPAAAPAGDLQALHRPRLRRQGARRGRALYGPAGPGARAVRRREIPDPGARPQPAAAADAPGPGRAPQPRLHAPRHDLAVRRARRRHRAGHRQMLRSPPRHRVPQNSSTRSRACPRAISTCISSWTTTPPTRRR